MRKIFPKIHISSFQIIIFGFLSVILIGAFLLALPFSSASGEWTSFSDALFTSTSAVCVTGLIVRDTATYWSLFGQFVILLLIQIGGLGVVTVALSIVLISGKKIGLKQRSTMQEAISAPQVGGMVRMTGFILKGVLIIEAIGAVLLSFSFCAEFGFWKGLWYAIFHSVSAFCNAGFDLIGVKAPFSSMTSYAANPWINLPLMLLIVIGGIGFFTWEDVLKNKWHFRRYSMQSKTILITSAFLILLPALYFFFFEFQDAPVGERIWLSLFQAITPRTAGFNTADLTMMTESGLMIIMSLMLVGGSPGSTAGGMKTTTLAVLVSSALAVFRRKENTHLFKRRVEDSIVKTAISLLIMYLALFLFGGILISRIEGLPLLTALFETASAVGTVGLSLGVTPALCAASRCILIVLMFLGRVGGLTLIYAAVSNKGAKISEYPKENITVG